MTEEKTSYPGQGGDDEDYSPPAPWHKSLSAHIPALVGSLILIIIVVWGLFHFLSLVQPWFSSLISKPIVTAPMRPSGPVASSLPKPVTTTSIHTSERQVTVGGRQAVRTAAPADLSVRILAVGVIDPVTGAFINRAPVSPSEVVAVQFDIVNEGGASTGAWYFDAQLPTASGGYPYSSPVQEPLGPGDHIVNTLRFSSVVSGGGMFNIIVDSQGMVDEFSETNNTATAFVPMMSYY